MRTALFIMFFASALFLVSCEAKVSSEPKNTALATVEVLNIGTDVYDLRQRFPEDEGSDTPWTSLAPREKATISAPRPFILEYKNRRTNEIVQQPVRIGENPPHYLLSESDVKELALVKVRNGSKDVYDIRQRFSEDDRMEWTPLAPREEKTVSAERPFTLECRNKRTNEIVTRSVVISKSMAFMDPLVLY